METTLDAVLGGRMQLRQPKRGHRVGHDAILLAAATDARAGEHAVDLGAGVGGAGLALAHRVEGLRVTLVEIDAGLAALAAENAGHNGLADRVNVIAGDAEDIGALTAQRLAPASIDHVLMNPPFNDPRRQNVSPDAGRRLAHVAAPGLLKRWAATAAILLKPGGVLTLIWRADAQDEVFDALSEGFGGISVLPVTPRPDAPPIRVLMRAIKGGAGMPVNLPALALNDAEGKPSTAVEAVLRAGETLSLARE